jgi:Na+/alanine symporter
MRGEVELRLIIPHALPIVWTFADVANALMALPNLIALILFNGVIVAETKKYLFLPVKRARRMKAYKKMMQ